MHLFGLCVKKYRLDITVNSELYGIVVCSGHATRRVIEGMDECASRTCYYTYFLRNIARKDGADMRLAASLAGLLWAPSITTPRICSGQHPPYLAPRPIGRLWHYLKIWSRNRYFDQIYWDLIEYSYRETIQFAE